METNTFSIKMNFKSCQLETNQTLKATTWLTFIYIVIYLSFINIQLATIDMERFAGLNIRGFSFMKFFVKILSRCIGHQCYYLPIAKNSWENICGNHEYSESLAQRIFPHLWYMANLVSDCWLDFRYFN